MIRDNLGPNGCLQSDKISRALLSHRNTPDPTSGISPAMIVFGRAIRDHIPRRDFLAQSKWEELARKREDSFLKRHYLKAEKLESGAKALKALNVGDNVYVQDQHGISPKKWSKSGMVVELLGFDSYLVKLDGSGHLTRRNRQFLRKFTPFSSDKVVGGCEMDLDICHSGGGYGYGAYSDPFEALRDMPLSAATIMDLGCEDKVVDVAGSFFGDTLF